MRFFLSTFDVQPSFCAPCEKLRRASIPDDRSQRFLQSGHTFSQLLFWNSWLQIPIAIAIAIELDLDFDNDFVNDFRFASFDLYRKNTGITECID